MTDRQFYDWQTGGGANDIMKMVSVLEEKGVAWCMIGGLAVNHWAKEPMVTQDVDIVIAPDRIDEAVRFFQAAGYSIERFPFSINLSGTSRVSIQISIDEAYKDFPARSVPADIHGMLMRVASLEDTLKGKVSAYSDGQRRLSKRQKDLADIARLIETHPEVQSRVPQPVLDKLRG
jgi:hypothetical protein